MTTTMHPARRFPKPLEAEVRREEQLWASVRAFAASSHWRTATEQADPARRTQ